MPATTERLKPAAWPTGEHTDAALEALSEALNVVDGLIDSHYSYLVDGDEARADGSWLREGVPVPTYEDLGVLSVFTDRLQAETDELTRWVEGLRHVLHLARLNGGREEGA